MIELQDKVELFPNNTDVGLAPKITVGAGVGGGTSTPTTVTVADLPSVPPSPEQFKVYVLLKVKAPVLWLPLTALAPLQSPEAVQEVALLELQEIVANPPLEIEIGETERLTVGGAGIVTPTVADFTTSPPSPMQVKVKVESELNAPVL